MCDALQETVEENKVAHEIKADDHHKRIIELETKIEMISQMGASANGDPGLIDVLNKMMSKWKIDQDEQIDMVLWKIEKLRKDCV